LQKNFHDSSKLQASSGKGHQTKKSTVVTTAMIAELFDELEAPISENQRIVLTCWVNGSPTRAITRLFTNLIGTENKLLTMDKKRSELILKLH
jgi:hypothetical protein